MDRESLAFWEARWQEQRNRSFLKQTQIAAPEKWAAFYDRTAGLWGRITGMGPETGNALADEILGQGLAGPDQSALELGCGPGHLSLALAKKGIRVTALDRSSGMIRTVQARAGQTGLAIKTLCQDWKKMPPEPGGHHLAIAACLPEAFSPSGICRMEGLAGRSCLLVMGRGSEVFPLRRQIWDQVMDQPCQVNGFHLECAENWLDAAGRRPKRYTISLPVTLDVSYPDAVDFYTAYFSMFRPRSRTGAKDPVLARAIQQVLAPFETHGRVRARGNADLAMIAWQKGTREKQVHDPDF